MTCIIYVKWWYAIVHVIEYTDKENLLAAYKQEDYKFSQNKK